MSLPLTLVTGPEQLLVDRAVATAIERAKEQDAELDVVRLEGDTYEPGALGVHASPSLFGGGTAIVVRGLDVATDELQADLLSYLAVPEPDVHLIVTFAGGNRAKKVVDALKGAGAHVVDAPLIKSDRDKSDFVHREIKAARRTIAPGAVQALIEAVGKDLRELAAACAQLVADTTGTIDEQVVETYHGGKVEATGFRVADAVLSGQTSEALRLLRHGLATGVDPVQITGLLAAQLRQLIKVGSAGRGQSSGALAKSLGLAPWQIDKARRQVGAWSGEGLATAVQGGGRDPVYAVERAILTITRARSHT